MEGLMWTVKGLLLYAVVTMNKHIIIPWLSTLNLPSMMPAVTINNHIIIP
jgi:hypothetical protein